MTPAPRTCGRCRTILEPRKLICGACGKRNVRRQPKHKAALNEPIEVFVAANGGYKGCWVCRELGVKMGGALQRDHDHRTGEPRGVLCPFHNRKLGAVYTRELVAAYYRYLHRDAFVHGELDELTCKCGYMGQGDDYYAARADVERHLEEAA